MKSTLFISALFFFIPLFLSANIFPVLDAPIEFEITPSAPKAGEIVRVHAHLSIENPLGATYVWRVNGQVVDQGVGRVAITRTLEGLGSATTIAVSVSVSGSVIAERSVTLRPASVDIIWEANTAQIPLVTHLPKPNGDSQITAVAVPHIVRANGTRVSANDLVYTWNINRSRTPARSGYGLQTFTFSTPQFENPFSVYVSVTTRDGDIQAEESVVIFPERPSVIFYEQAPLLGLRVDRAVRESVTLQGEEVTISAFPLTINEGIITSYEWRANRQTVTPSEEDPRTITFRRTGEGRGLFTIEFSAEGFQSLFERVRSSFLLTL